MPVVCYLWFRPILSEQRHTAGESAARNKGRAPSGPVKVLVTDREPKRRQNVVDVYSGASSLLAWFPASWASKIAPEFLKNPTESGQLPQIQELACPKRAGADEVDRQHKLQAVRFSAKDMPFFDLDINSAIRDGDYFAELIQGYSDNLIEPNIMRALQPVKPCRTTLEVIIPSKDGLSPEQWKETATLCPRSLSADNLENATQLDTDKPSPVHDDLAAEVDYGSSPERTPPRRGTRTPSSTDRSPTRSHRPPPGSNKPDGTSAIMPCPKGVILVSEAFTEINAGFVVVLASMHTPPVPPRVLADPDLDPDEAVGAVVRAYHIHVETYLATTFPPVDVDQWVASGLLGFPPPRNGNLMYRRLVSCMEHPGPVVWSRHFPCPCIASVAATWAFEKDSRCISRQAA